MVKLKANWIILIKSKNHFHNTERSSPNFKLFLLPKTFGERVAFRQEMVDGQCLNMYNAILKILCATQVNKGLMGYTLMHITWHVYSLKPHQQLNQCENEQGQVQSCQISNVAKDMDKSLISAQNFVSRSHDWYWWP